MSHVSVSSAALSCIDILSMCLIVIFTNNLIENHISSIKKKKSWRSFTFELIDKKIKIIIIIVPVLL